MFDSVVIRIIDLPETKDNRPDKSLHTGLAQKLETTCAFSQKSSAITLIDKLKDPVAEIRAAGQKHKARV